MRSQVRLQTGLHLDSYQDERNLFVRSTTETTAATQDKIIAEQPVSYPVFESEWGSRMDQDITAYFGRSSMLCRAWRLIEWCLKRYGGNEMISAFYVER